MRALAPARCRSPKVTALCDQKTAARPAHVAECSAKVTKIRKSDRSSLVTCLVGFRFHELESARGGDVTMFHPELGRRLSAFLLAAVARPLAGISE
jgi:hypothetical protein